MKRFPLLFALCALVLPAFQPVRGAEVSADLFYDNLNGGNWYEVTDYGYVWQPDVASDPNWRPYTDGYWAYTDQGWTWVSYEDFGWATYHYGRWARLADYGWVWVPGTEWAPAWVSWRTGGDYVGWAPLPPAGGGEVVYEGRPISGHVDIEFGIGPAYYNFVDLRYIGEPVLRDRILPYERNVTVINNTVNVTNITYNNSTVYNYGPDYATVSRYSVRPIQRLKLERQTTADPLQAVRSGNVTKVQGNTLVVAAPQRIQKAASAQIAPKQVKAKIEQPKVEKGWTNIDPAQKAKLEQSFKTQNAKNIPKPDIQPSNQNAAASEGAAVGAPPAERAGKANRKNQQAQQAGQRQQAEQGSPAAASPNAAEQGKGRNKNRAERAEAAASPTLQNQSANAGEQQGKGKNKNRAQRGEAAASPAAAENQNRNAGEQPGKAGRDKNRAERNGALQQGANGLENAGAENQQTRRNEANRSESNVAPARRAGAAAANERNPVKSENQNPSRVRENAAGAQGGVENSARPGQERARGQMQNPPVAGPRTGAGPNRPGHEAAKPGVQEPAQQQRGEGANQQKLKNKKHEGEATPAPQ